MKAFIRKTGNEFEITITKNGKVIALQYRDSMSLAEGFCRTMNADIQQKNTLCIMCFKNSASIAKTGCGAQHNGKKLCT